MIMITATMKCGSGPSDINDVDGNSDNDDNYVVDDNYDDIANSDNDNGNDDYINDGCTVKWEYSAWVSSPKDDVLKI